MNLQVINTLNNNSVINSNINFNAHFIDDKNGYFRKLWQDAVINDSLKKAVDSFFYSNKEHVLEITNVAKNGTEYTVFNHRNGYEKVCNLHNIDNLRLEELIEKIMNSKFLFNKGDNSTKMYQKLTGQKVDIDCIV